MITFIRFTLFIMFNMGLITIGIWLDAIDIFILTGVMWIAFDRIFDNWEVQEDEDV